MEYTTIRVEDLTENYWNKIGKEWMLISACKNGICNCMTASWGGIGVLWNKNVFFCFVRPQRYTKQFCDSSDIITLSFFGEKYRDALRLCGRVSGRDTDKIKDAGLSVSVEKGNIPVFEESEMTIIGKKLFSQDMTGESFIDKEILSSCYPAEDFHTVYVCEIIEVRKKA